MRLTGVHGRPWQLLCGISGAAGYSYATECVWGNDSGAGRTLTKELGYGLISSWHLLGLSSDWVIRGSWSTVCWGPRSSRLGPASYSPLGRPWRARCSIVQSTRARGCTPKVSLVQKTLEKPNNRTSISHVFRAGKTFVGPLGKVFTFFTTPPTHARHQLCSCHIPRVSTSLTHRSACRLLRFFRVSCRAGSMPVRRGTHAGLALRPSLQVALHNLRVSRVPFREIAHPLLSGESLGALLGRPLYFGLSFHPSSAKMQISARTLVENPLRGLPQKCRFQSWLLHRKVYVALKSARPPRRVL